MIVAGIMSGTSGDGIDIALVKIAGERNSPHLNLLSHYHHSYPEHVRQAVLAAMNAPTISVAQLARLNFLLGELYAKAVTSAIKKSRSATLDLIGCHGQTLYHQGERLPFLQRKITATWQTGEAAIIATRLSVPVVSDFRTADLAVGGKGAPLVPLLDYVLFREKRRGRSLQNIGGIANMTAIPAAASQDEVIAFDTGPGNMVIDGAMRRLFGRDYDRDGRVAATGSVIEEVLRNELRNPFFSQRPPKTAGREQFGEAFTEAFIHKLKNSSQFKRNADVIATATALTVHSIAASLRFCRQCKFDEMIVSGGGAKNQTLMRMLKELLSIKKINVKTSDEFAIPAEAKEAVAFALLAYQTWHRLPGNLPSATGASKPAILGKISFPPPKS